MNIDSVLDRWEYDRWARDLIAPGNHDGHADVMRYLSRKPNLLVYSDCSAMISPEMFEEVVMPALIQQCERYPGRAVFHLDGPNMIRHVGLICSIPSIHAIQWVYGSGNPPGLDPKWDALYTRILDAGKRICLCGVPPAAAAVKSFFARFPKAEFEMRVLFRSRDAAESFIAQIHQS
jgi:hypothetical protein